VYRFIIYIPPESSLSRGEVVGGVAEARAEGQTQSEQGSSVRGRFTSEGEVMACLVAGAEACR
jgi:hypothetical protein